MKKLFLLLLIVPIVSFWQTPYSSYYENGNLKEKWPGYYEAIKYKISAKSGLNLRENPDLRSKKIAKIPYNTAIYLKDKPGIKLTVFDTDKKTGITKLTAQIYAPLKARESHETGNAAAVIANDVSLDKQLIITGPNAAGKTTVIKTTLFNLILSQQIG